MINTNSIININLQPSAQDIKNVQTICQNTQNTWQQNRNIKQKEEDTLIGKLCEKALFQYFKNWNNIFVIDYDDVRQDNFKNHAPLDFVLYTDQQKTNNISELLKNKSISQNPQKMSEDERQFLFKCSGYTCELKSTRITKRHFEDNQNNINFQSILNDDFLCYPRYLRKSINIETFESYFSYCKENNFASNKKELCQNEIANMEHIYFRSYVQKNDSYYSIFLIGCINKGLFFDQKKCEFNIKKMPQKNKSEHAIYIATKINNSYSIDHLMENLNAKKQNNNKPKI